MDRRRRSTRAGPGSVGGLLELALLVALLAGSCATSPAGPTPSPSSRATPVATTPAPTAPGSPPAGGPTAVLVGAGDIAACGRGGPAGSAAARTAAVVAGIAGTVFTAGDDAYEDGTPAQFAGCYDPTWGAFKSRTMPAPGNHDFNTPGGAGYFEYFGTVAGTPGEGWYSYELGAWHVVVLDSNCTIVACGPGSPQLTWLMSDLAAHPAMCTMAIWHHPRFSSGYHGADQLVGPFWDVLDQAGADVVVNGHDHDYERFVPQDPDGKPDQIRGIREFVVGTGGAGLRSFAATSPTTEVRDATTHGVIAFTLRPTGYDWRFIPVPGSKFTDAGSGDCH